ncbi:MAG: DUF167 domain-containing protein [Chloroflexota bacterium]
MGGGFALIGSRLSQTVRFTVRVTPRGGADRVDGVGPDGELRLRVRAPAAEGAANEAVLRMLADVLGIARSSVSLERGAAARLKLVSIEGSPAAEIRARWPTLGLTERGS